MHASKIFLAGAMMICAPLFSHAGTVLKTVPESCAEGKALSVQDVTVRRTGLPAYGRFTWDANGNVTKEWPADRLYTLPEPEGEGIVYGESVSRNEFGIDGGVFPSPDGSRLAVYRKDESRVTMFPLLDINSRTGSLLNIRYPMNGMASEHITLCVCDTLGNVLASMKVDDFTDERYLTGITWSPDGGSIYIQVLDREQHHMHLNRYSSTDGAYLGTVLTEENGCWVEPYEPLHFIDGSNFIYSTDNRDGYKSLYLCDDSGIKTRLTPVTADVRYAADCKSGKVHTIFYTSAEVSPVENHLFSVSLSITKKKVTVGKPRRLTMEEGWHDVNMSPDCSAFIDRWSSFGNPGATAVKNADGTLREILVDGGSPIEGIACPEVEFGTVKSADGKFDNYWRFFKPLNFDPSKKYPLIVYVYGGPHSQMVKDSWLGGVRMWEMLMAQKGYAVYVQDNRGTSNRGAEFEKAINRSCGKAEMEDQMAGLGDLLERCPWIDRERIGIHGWSYGGFMTLSLFTSYPEVFKTGVAGGPVIDWKWYEVMYGERYMDTPVTNPEGFGSTSLMGRVDGMHGHMLICQGAVDKTVVWEHSLSFIQECINKGKRVDYFPYPCSEHNMSGKARVHLYDKITQYFEDYL